MDTAHARARTHTHTLRPVLISCRTLYTRNMVCFRYVIVNTFYKGDKYIIIIIIIIRMARQSQTGLGHLIVESSWSHTDTPHSVGLLWTSDQPDST
jgi:hypothetical protein